MTPTTPEERSRRAAVAEDGITVSAGGRVAHVRLAVESGRVFHVDLSQLAETDRPAVIAEIQETIARAMTKATSQGSNPAAKAS